MKRCRTWQNQAGGIYPGAKLLLSGPGLHQRVRVETLASTAERAAGAKLARAGGGDFLMLLARSPEKAAELRRILTARADGGAVFEWRIAEEGLRIKPFPLRTAAP